MDICEIYENKIKEIVKEYEIKSGSNYSSYVIVGMVLLDLLTDENIDKDEYMSMLFILKSLREVYRE